MNAKEAIDEYGKALRRIRRYAGVSQSELAQSANVTLEHIRNIESGNAKLSLNLVLNVAQYFNMPIDLFFPELIDDESILIDYKYKELFKSCSPEETLFVINQVKLLIDELHRRSH